MQKQSKGKVYSRRWRETRLRHLAREPLCRMCSAKGLVVAANVVDHIEPHRGDKQRFWSRDNWQSLCGTCHNSTKQRLERAALAARPMCNADGTPTDVAW